MTYYESYSQLATIEEIKTKASEDAEIAALIMGNNPDRIKAIEDAMNKAIAERSMECG